MDLTDAGDRNDGTDASFFDFYFIQTVELIQLADLGLNDLVGVVVVTDDHILVYTDGTVVYFTDTDTSYIFIIINGTDQYLGSRIRISFRERGCSLKWSQTEVPYQYPFRQHPERQYRPLRKHIRKDNPAENHPHPALRTVPVPRLRPHRVLLRDGRSY